MKKWIRNNFVVSKKGFFLPYLFELLDQGGSIRRHHGPDLETYITSIVAREFNLPERSEIFMSPVCVPIYQQQYTRIKKIHHTHPVSPLWDGCLRWTHEFLRFPPHICELGQKEIYYYEWKKKPRWGLPFSCTSNPDRHIRCPPAPAVFVPSNATHNKAPIIYSEYIGRDDFSSL